MDYSISVPLNSSLLDSMIYYLANSLSLLSRFIYLPMICFEILCLLALFALFALFALLYLLLRLLF